jgi:hypothetical protein
MVDFDTLCNGAVEYAFGEPMTYQGAAGGSYPVQGVFSEPYRRQEFDGDGGVKWITVAPSVGIRTAQLKAAVSKNDRVTRQSSGITYLIVEPQPNGIGWVNLKLKESA